MDQKQTLDVKTISKVLHSLKVISAIKENDRLTTQKGIHVQRSDTLLQALVRWMASENRVANVSVLKQLFDRAFELCHNLVEQRNKTEEKDKLGRLECQQWLNRLMFGISTASVAAMNLKVTYQQDSHIIASLDLLYETVKDQLSRIKLLVKEITGEFDHKGHIE